MDAMQRDGMGGQLAPFRAPAEEGRSGLVKFGLPWILAVVVLMAGVVAHLAWSQGPALPWITAALTLAVVGLTWLAWTVTGTKRLGPVGRVHIAGTVAAIGLWLLLALVLGPFTRGVLDAWGLGGAVLAVSWNLRSGLHRPSGRRDDEDGSMTPRKAGRALLSSLGLRGEDLVADEVSEHRIGGRLQLNSGNNTFEDAQKKSLNFATALGIPKTGVRFTPDPKNAATAEFSFTLRDVLADPTPWPGPSCVGGTVFDPIPMGLYETGEVLRKTLADKNGAKHELQQGTTGSGKSSGAKIELCEVMTRREVGIIVIDTTKALQTFGPAAPGLALFITETAKAEQFVGRLMRVVTGRASFLGARRLSEWVPGCGLTYLVVQIEEASNLFAAIGDDQVAMLVKAARSAGVSIKISLQRPSHDEMSTTTRAQLGTVSCYGMAADDPVCMLPDAVQDAGADPRQWGDRQPGCCYVAGTGITVGKAATPLRTYAITVAEMEAHALRWGPQMDEIDPVTARLLGDLWTKRERPIDVVARLEAEALRGIDGMTDVIDGEVVDTGDWDDDEINDENEGGVTVLPEDMGVSTEDDDPADADVTFDDEIESFGIDLAFGPPPVEATVEQARAAVADRLTEFLEKGSDTIRVPDFADLVASGMRSRAWFRKELQRLGRVGRLVEEGDGVFRIVEIDDPDTERSAA